MYANPQIEQMGREDMEALQLARLKKTLKWALEKSRFYQEKLAGCQIAELESLDDIRRLPFTNFAELLKKPKLEFLTMPMSSVLRISLQHHPMEVAKLYSNGDIAHTVEMMSRILVADGVNQTSTAGILGDLSDSRLLDIHYALELLGAASVPLGTDFHRAVALMELSQLDTLITTPQLAMQLIIQTQTMGKDIGEYPLQRIFCLNEALLNPLRRHLEERTGARVYDLFSSVELGTAAMLFPCTADFGMHVQEDYFYPEIIEFSSECIIKDSSKMGELVVTTLGAEAMPLIRYRTGQAVMRVDTPCPCGRTLLRIITPFGRS